jgi:hypothetical protein
MAAAGLGNGCLAEKFGQSRLDIRSPHDIGALLLLLLSAFL